MNPLLAIFASIIANEGIDQLQRYIADASQREPSGHVHCCERQCCCVEDADDYWRND
jgi:hypothetical protein